MAQPFGLYFGLDCPPQKRDCTPREGEGNGPAERGRTARAGMDLNQKHLRFGCFLKHEDT